MNRKTVFGHSIQMNLKIHPDKNEELDLPTSRPLSRPKGILQTTPDKKLVPHFNDNRSEVVPTHGVDLAYQQTGISEVGYFRTTQKSSPTERKPPKILSKSETLKNTLTRPDSFSES